MTGSIQGSRYGPLPHVGVYLVVAMVMGGEEGRGLTRYCNNTIA